MLPVSLGSQVLGRKLADPLTLGQATLVTNYTDLGLIGGALGGLILEDLLYHDEFNSTALSFATLVGEVGGAIAGNVRARSWDCTEGQVIADRTGGLLGAAVPCVLYYALTNASPEHSLTAVGVLGIAGATAGTYWTEKRIRDIPLSTSGGYIAAGTTIGGALLGSGVGVIFGTEPRLIAITGSLGGIAGFFGGLTLAQSLQPGESGRASLGSSRLEINYAAIAGAASEYSSRRTFNAPDLVRFRF
jgi:hypothetical protein